MATPGLGDIANIVKLGVKVATLLHEAAKIAPKEIRDIIQQVDYLHAVLRSTKTALEDHGAILRQHPDIKRAIAKVFRNCEETLNELHEVAKEYERAIQRDGVPRDEATVKERWAKAFKTGYLRAKFLTMDEALAGINENLRGHMAALNLMMQNLHRYVVLLRITLPLRLSSLCLVGEGGGWN